MTETKKDKAWVVFLPGGTKVMVHAEYVSHYLPGRISFIVGWPEDVSEVVAEFVEENICGYVLAEGEIVVGVRE